MTLGISSITGSLPSASALRCQYRSPANSIDFTGKNTLKINCTYTISTASTGLYIEILTTRDSRTQTVIASVGRTTVSSATETIELDVSAIESAYILVVSLRSTSGSISTSGSATINNIWLE